MDQNLLFNKDTRMFAFDDSPFLREDRVTHLVGIIMRKDLYLETVLKKEITVDGNDVTEKVLESMEEKGSGVNLIMVKGVTFAGFNILDMPAIYNKTGIPVINVIDHEPDTKAIKDALMKYFPDWEHRWNILKRRIEKVGSIFLQAEGIETKVAYKFIKQVTVNGSIPEPLRIADLIAGLL